MNIAIKTVLVLIVFLVTAAWASSGYSASVWIGEALSSDENPDVLKQIFFFAVILIAFISTLGSALHEIKNK